MRPLGSKEIIEQIASTGVTAFSVELIPRTTRAQAMDALSSMGTICGYKAVLIGGRHAAQDFSHAHYRRGNHYSSARPGDRGWGRRIAGDRHGPASGRGRLRLRSSAGCKEQVQSLGGRFVELPIEAKDAQDARGYATAQDEAFYARQRELLGRVVAESDVVIAAAVVPGKKSPVLVTKEMVQGMAPGSVIFDLAAERGGNCELTRSGETIVEHGVTIIGRINLASTVPYHASQMYARNLTAFLLHLVKKGQLDLNLKDEIIRETLVTRGGEDRCNARVREIL